MTRIEKADQKENVWMAIYAFWVLLGALIENADLSIVAIWPF